MKYRIICNNCNNRITNVEALIRQALEVENSELNPENKEEFWSSDRSRLQRIWNFIKRNF